MAEVRLSSPEFAADFSFCRFAGGEAESVLRCGLRKPCAAVFMSRACGSPARIRAIFKEE